MRSLGVHRIGARGVIGPVAVILLVLLLAVAVSGCQIQMGLNTTVKDNGSGTFGFRLAADKEILDLMGQQGGSSDDLFGELKKNLPQDWKSEEGTDPDGTKWVKVSVEFKDTDELQTILKDAGSGVELDLSSFSLTQKKGFFSTTTEYSLKLDMASALSGIGDIGGMGDQLTPSVLSSILVFENRVTLPGSIKSNNATKVEGNTLIWQPQLSGSTEMTATSESIRWSIIYILIGAVVVLIALLVIVIILLARRGRKQVPPSEAAAGDHAPAPEAPHAEGYYAVSEAPAANAYAQAVPAADAAAAPTPPVAPMVAPMVPDGDAWVAPTEVIPVAAPAAPAPVPMANPLIQSIPRATTEAEPSASDAEATVMMPKAVPAATPAAEAPAPAMDPFATSIPQATTAPEPEDPGPRP